MIHSKQNIPQLKIALLLIVTFLLLSSCGPEKSEDVKDVTCIICTETEAPTNPSITINGGNAGTNSTEVTLTLAASDNTGIRGYYVSENATTPDRNDAAWVAVPPGATSYSDNVSFTLSSGDGPKPVTAWFKDYVGSMTSSVTTTAPWNPSVSVIKDNTSSSSVILALSASDDDGVTGYYASQSTSAPAASDSGWVAVTSTTSYSDNISFTFPNGSLNSYPDNTSFTFSTGDETVFVWFQDTVNNISFPAKSPLSFYDTAVDPATGLMWQREDDGTMRNWSNAGSYCSNLSLAGYSDWRLPTKDELVSIVDTSFGSPTINTDVFPNTQPSRYWSSTSYASNTTYAWDVSFLDGDVNADAKTNSNSNVVRCVRG